MKPILFNTEMVNAILQGRKTQTRRITKTQPDSRGFRTTDTSFEDYHGRKVNPPYRPGDILYVRETWTWAEDTSYDEHVSNGGWKYKADFSDFAGAWKWRPSIHMPKEAARIFLRVKSVRVERLCDISEEDAIAEGVETLGLYPGYEVSSRGKFEGLWNLINGDGSWDANPWVWVIEFERIPDPR